MWKWLDVSSLFVLPDWYAQLTLISYRRQISTVACVCAKRALSKRPLLEVVVFRGQGRTYVVMHTAAGKVRHGAISRSRIVVLDKPVVEALVLKRRNSKSARAK